MNLRTLNHEEVSSFKPHSAAELFPPLSEGEYLHLKRDIKKNGILQPIIAIERDDKTEIIDGRHRWQIAVELELDKIPFKFMPRNTSATRVWMNAIDMNSSRRHMDKSQRAMVAARISLTSPPGRPNVKEVAEDEGFMTTNKAADYLRVGKSSVQQAKDVLRTGNKQLIQLVVDGKKNVSDAYFLHKNYPERIVKASIAQAKKELKNTEKDDTLVHIANSIIKAADTTPKVELLKETFKEQSMNQVVLLLREYNDEWHIVNATILREDKGYKLTITFKDK